MIDSERDVDPSRKRCDKLAALPGVGNWRTRTLQSFALTGISVRPRAPGPAEIMTLIEVFDRLRGRRVSRIDFKDGSYVQGPESFLIDLHDEDSPAEAWIE